MMRDERTEEKPPYSKLFIVCSKQLKEEDLLPLFESHGEIEDLHMPKDRNTGESKGIAYVKYTKTSSAAAAIESLHMTHIHNSNKPIKVMVASHKSQERNDNPYRYKRLFIKVSKDKTEKDVKEHFSKFGHIVNVRIQKDKDTNEGKGFAYVNYNTFLEAAIGYEQCDKKYKPVFATPRDDLKRPRNGNHFDDIDKYPCDSMYMRESKNEIGHNYREQQFRENINRKEAILPLIKTTAGDFDTLSVLCNPYVPQKSIQKLFNIIPGMTQFKFTSDSSAGSCTAIVKYESKIAAAHAMETLNNYEFPSGEVISVKAEENPLNKVANNLTNIVNSFKSSIDSNPDLMQLADAIVQASSLIKAATSSSDVRERDTDSFTDSNCSVKLPPVKPLANINSKVVKRCFIVFKPQPLPVGILRDIFCRFGDLIDVSALANKTFGFARFASEQSALDAMKTLNGAIVYGVTLKVLEAEEKPKKEEKMLVDDSDDNECNDERKRAKLDSLTT